MFSKSQVRKLIISTSRKSFANLHSKMEKMKQNKFALAILTLAIFVIPTGLSAKANTWDNVERIAGNISTPAFSSSWVSILDFGAKDNDPNNSAGDAINRAILFVSRQGGGTVIVPEGTWQTGSITMKSNVCLKLSKNSTLKFLPQKELYFPAVPTRIEGIDCNNTHPLIYAWGENNIAIIGEGSIDVSEITSLQDSCAIPANWLTSPKPIHERTLTVEDGIKAQTINFCQCTRAMIEGVTILDSPTWAIHALLCEDLTIKNIKINSQGAGDGCCIESCKNALLETGEFGTSGEGISIRSGRFAGEGIWNTNCENIVIRNCHIQNGSEGIVIGDEIAGGCKNVYIENCRISSGEIRNIFNLKTSTLRGGTIENIYIRNVEAANCKEAILKIDLNHTEASECAADESTSTNQSASIKNIYLDNVNCSQSEYGLWISGRDNPRQLNNISLENCNFEGVKKGENHIEGTFSDIFFRKSKINDKPAIL